MPLFDEKTLTDFAAEMFTRVNVPAAAARRVAASLVDANLRGHDSHGVMRVPSYIAQIEEKRLDPAASLSVERESPAALVADGNWGLGIVLAHDLTDRLIEKCRSSAVACGTLRRSSHIGRLGEYAEKAAAQGFASIILANTHGAAQRVAPPGGKAPRLGTNPICIGMPGGKEGPFILDIGTSATAEGKVRVKRIGGLECPPGWILDSEGRPTTDPNTLYGNPPGSILPLGGDQGYKGFGLAFMIEMMCGGFSGGPCAHPNPPAPIGNCAWFMVMNPEFFAGSEHLQKEVSQLEAYTRATPLVDTVKEIMLPGDPERRSSEVRRAGGIPLDDGNWKALVQLADRLGVAAPAGEPLAG